MESKPISEDNSVGKEEPIISQKKDEVATINHVDNLVNFYANSGIVSSEVSKKSVEALERVLRRCGFDKLRGKSRNEDGENPDCLSDRVIFEW